MPINRAMTAHEWGLVMGMLNNVLPFCLLVWAQTQITGALASVLNATTPLFAVVVANALTADERLTAGRLAGVVLGFLGVAVMLGGQHSAPFS